MSSSAHADRLAHMINATGLAQVVNQTFRDGQVTALFRVLPNNEAGWNVMMVKLLEATEHQIEGTPPWKLDISKPYMLKGGKLVFGWRLSLQSADTSFALDVLNSILKGNGVPPQLGGETMEMVFTGMQGQSDRNKPKPGSFKGVLRINDKSNPLRGERE
jgi:hypothetical protein